MMEPDGAIVSQRVLNKSIGVLTVILIQTFVLLGQIHTIRLNPCRNPCLVVAAGHAVRQVQLIG